MLVRLFSQLLPCTCFDVNAFSTVLSCEDFMGMETPGRFSTILTRDTIFVTSSLFPSIAVRFRKWVYSKMTEFAHRGSKFISF